MKAMLGKRAANACTALAAVAVIALSGCGGDDDAGERTDPASVGSQTERYCALSRQLAEARAETVGAVASDDSATARERERAERKLAEDNTELLAALVEAAPPEIANQVATLVGEIEARANLRTPGGSASRQLREARGRITDWESENCRASVSAP